MTSSPDISLVDYPSSELGSMATVIAMMLDSLKRIIEYPALGFQTFQHVPVDVMAAYSSLLHDVEMDNKLAQLPRCSKRR